MKKYILLLGLTILFIQAQGQALKWEGREFKISNVNASIVSLNGEEVLRVERDLEVPPVDFNNPITRVDEPTFVKLTHMDFRDGVIEVKVLSRLLESAPPFARGFIGVAFRIKEDNSTFESIYIRPTNGRAEDQLRRNHTVQYFSYPDYKFQRLRDESSGKYETYADIGLDEWITMRIEVKGKEARLYLNNQKHPSFIVSELLGETTSGSIGLWVEIGTEGYFKDLIIEK